MHTKRVYSKFDYLLAGLVILVSVCGVILIGSATRTAESKFSSEFYSQIIWVLSGVLLMLAAAFVDFKVICRFYIPIYIVNIFLLIAVLIFGYATDRDTYRWIGIGTVGILPSEFSKVFMVIFLSTLIAGLNEKINKFWIFLIIVGLTLVPTALIAVEPSLSASLVTVVICVVLLYVGKLKYRYFIAGLLLIIPIFAIIVYDVNSTDRSLLDQDINPPGRILMDKLGIYQQKRVLDFFNPDTESEGYYQTHQSIKAISAGKLTGKGLYNNDIGVPWAQNDFIFSIIGAEFGFAGSVTILALLFLIVAKCLIVAFRSQILLGKLLASGCATILGLQVFVNVGVATGLLPNTGITFPFISTGGSSMWACFIAVGLVINVRMTRTKNMFEE